MEVIQINSGCWNTAGNQMLFLKPEIFFPDVSVEELFSKPVEDTMHLAREQYAAYLESVMSQINKKLWKLYNGKVLGLTEYDRRLHDFIIKQIVYDGAAYYNRRKSDGIRLVLDAHGDYEYELIFKRVCRFYCQNDNEAYTDFFRGIGEIVLCEIGVINDIPGCCFLNCRTSGGCNMSIWFHGFDLHVCKKAEVSQPNKEKKS